REALVGPLRAPPEAYLVRGRAQNLPDLELAHSYFNLASAIVVACAAVALARSVALLAPGAPSRALGCECRTPPRPTRRPFRDDRPRLRPARVVRRQLAL